MIRAFSALLITTLSSMSLAHADVEIEWIEFQKDPAAFMERPLVKKTRAGEPLSRGTTLFSNTDLSSKKFIDKKVALRRGSGRLSTPICNADGICVDDVMSGRSKAKSKVEDFLDMEEFKERGLTPIKSLEKMALWGLKSAELEESPWSDSYWPLSQGALGSRYLKSNFSDLGHDWKARFDLVNSERESLRAILNSRDAAAINSLSPSEKYDILIGDLGGEYQAGYLTPTQWTDGGEYFKEEGKVESWMGICHGWAAASFMLPRPRHTVETPSANGMNQVTFYPSDLKGLASYSWSVADVTSNFLGGRCNTKDPKKDKESGRILNEDCFDTNPANWHVGIVNQIGVAKRSFIMDATYDYEVWNQPVHSYKYSYFNPQTGKSAWFLATGKVKMENFTNDKFKKFRSKEAVSVIGISMDVTYVVETKPTDERTDSADRDALETVTYMYDLELDADGQIVGGEWYSNKHPDFLWLPPAKSRALSYGDKGLQGSWTPGTTVPAFWREIAVKTALKHGQPLAAIIEPLLEAANH